MLNMSTTDHTAIKLCDYGDGRFRRSLKSVRVMTVLLLKHVEPSFQTVLLTPCSGNADPIAASGEKVRAVLSHTEESVSTGTWDPSTAEERASQGRRVAHPVHRGQAECSTATWCRATAGVSGPLIA